MAGMQAVYYRGPDGSQPVSDLIDDLEVTHQVAIDNRIERLNVLTSRKNPLCSFPDSSQAKGELRELRCHYGRAHYRVLYRQSGGFFLLLHIFRKTSREIPPREIVIAEKRWDDFKLRMDAAKRKPPRAIGRDAP